MLDTLWAITAEGYREFKASCLSLGINAVAFGRDMRTQPQTYDVVGNVAVFKASGIMLEGADPFLDMFGVDYVNASALAKGVQAAVSDKDVKGVFVNLETPGGVVQAVAPLDGAFKAVRDAGMPLGMHSDQVLASAGYWPATRATHLTAGPQAAVGSIGVMRAVVDSKKSAEQAGETYHYITSGPDKALGHYGTDSTPEQRERVQANVNAAFAPFKKAVADGRGLSGPALAAATTGGTFIGEPAVAAGLIDRVVSDRNTAFEAFTKELNMTHKKKDETPKTETAEAKAEPVISPDLSKFEARLQSLEAKSAEDTKTIEALKADNEKLRATAAGTLEVLKTTRETQLKAMIDEVQNAGRLAPADRPKFEAMAEKYKDDVDGFKAILDVLPKVVAEDAQNQTPPEQQGTPTSELEAQASKLGVTVEDLKLAEDPAMAVDVIDGSVEANGKVIALRAQA